MQKLILYIQPQLTTTTTTQDFVRVDLMEEELISLTQVLKDLMLMFFVNQELN